MKGEDESINEAMGQLLQMLALALVFMYLIMVHNSSLCSLLLSSCSPFLWHLQEDFWACLWGISR